MNDFWDWLSESCDEDDYEIRIKRVGTSNSDSNQNRAGVVALGEKATLIVPEQMMVKAAEGQNLSNFQLAHEFAHLALGHHETGAVIKNFQLFESKGVNANIPPNVEELEANFAAVFFQCGMALFDTETSPLHLANLASSDPLYVEKAIKICRLEGFQRELTRLNTRYVRVIL
jgi:hypothetical protein